MERERNPELGFTLWELLLVLFLMGVLLTTLTPHFGSAPTWVRQRVDLANRQKIDGAVQLYRIDVGNYPLSVPDLIQAPNGVSGWCGPYLDEMPKNPFDAARNYEIGPMGQVR